MRVVITGATGFIGSNLARVFLEQGAHVYALVRPGSLHLDALPAHERLHTVACDLAHVLECVPEVGHADGFFHMAWGGVNREEIDSPEVQAAMWQAPWTVWRQPDVWDAGYSWTLVPEWNTGLLTESWKRKRPAVPSMNTERQNGSFTRRQLPFAAVWAFTITI